MDWDSVCFSHCMLSDYLAFSFAVRQLLVQIGSPPASTAIITFPHFPLISVKSSFGKPFHLGLLPPRLCQGLIQLSCLPDLQNLCFLFPTNWCCWFFMSCSENKFPLIRFPLPTTAPSVLLMTRLATSSSLSLLHTQPSVICFQLSTTPALIKVTSSLAAPQPTGVFLSHSLLLCLALLPVPPQSPWEVTPRHTSPLGFPGFFLKTSSVSAACSASSPNAHFVLASVLSFFLFAFLGVSVSQRSGFVLDIGHTSVTYSASSTLNY